MVFRGHVIYFLMPLKKQLVTQVIIFSSVTQQGNTFSYQCWFLLVTSQPSILNMTWKFTNGTSLTTVKSLVLLINLSLNSCLTG